MEKPQRCICRQNPRRLFPSQNRSGRAFWRGQENGFDFEDRVEQREVRYGRSGFDYVPVWEGVEEGEKILISGHTRLSDGATVLVVEN